MKSSFTPITEILLRREQGSSIYFYDEYESNETF